MTSKVFAKDYKEEKGCVTRVKVVKRDGRIAEYDRNKILIVFAKQMQRLTSLRSWLTTRLTASWQVLRI